MLHIKSINKKIRSLGIDLELINGPGYFYFVGPGSENLYTASVLVYKLNHLTLDQWIEYAQQYQKEIDNAA